MNILLIIYSILLVIGGLIGFLTAGSLVSLIMSAGFALLIIASLFINQYFPMIGYTVTYALLILLSAFFLYRTVHTGKFLPAGLLTLISLGVLALLFTQRKA